MPISARHIAILSSLTLLGSSLSGCGTVNGYLASGVSDTLPQWAGGLPPDAPPRPGTAKYDEFIREREQKRNLPAPPRDEAAKANASALEPLH